MNVKPESEYHDPQPGGTESDKPEGGEYSETGQPEQSNLATATSEYSDSNNVHTSSEYNNPDTSGQVASQGTSGIYYRNISIAR